MPVAASRDAVAGWLGFRVKARRWAVDELWWFRLLAWSIGFAAVRSAWSSS